MKIKCVETTNRYLKQYGYGNCNPHVEYGGLYKGDEFYVHCLKQTNGGFYCLVEIRGYPNFYPLVLFEIIDNTMPSAWAIKMIDKSSFTFQNWQMIIGDNIYHDDDFLYNLILSDDNAIKKWGEFRLDNGNF
jgi:hypothetical protein